MISLHTVDCWIIINKELVNFCARYVKTLKLIVAKNGTFSFEIQNR